jgi:putative transposase
MLFALLYALLRRVIGSGHPSADRELQIEVVVLRHQVKVLSRKVGRPKLRRIDRALLAACSRVVPRHRWGSFIVAPSTLLRWHRELVRRKWTYRQKRLGRPPIDPKLAALISRMARENPRWGYMRIKGECRKLGISVAATTVKKVLRAAGFEPAPRRDGPSWGEFLRGQAHGILACDFFSIETVFLSRGGDVEAPAPDLDEEERVERARTPRRGCGRPTGEEPLDGWWNSKGWRS